MWIIIILLIVAFFLFVFIRGGNRLNKMYQVVNKNGTRLHIGTYTECKSFAKSQNDYCKTFSIDDFFIVKRYKF